ncbi:MAG: glutathione S-transferase family protein [Alphaproteobacteria bacterium]
MKLRWAPGSPFVRKVTVTAIEVGLDNRIERMMTDYHKPDSDIIDHNPLGKVPAMILDDGDILVDSSVICAYLDSLHDGNKLIPNDPRYRYKVLSLEALADCMTESAINVQRENSRPAESQSDVVRDKQWGKFERAMDWINATHSVLEGPLNIGHIAVATGVGWVEFRMGDTLGDWKSRWGMLGAWYDQVSERPSFQATVPK